MFMSMLVSVGVVLVLRVVSVVAFVVAVLDGVWVDAGGRWAAWGGGRVGFGVL